MVSVARLLLAALAVAAVTACDDGGSATPDTTESAATEATTTSAPSRDQRRADDAALDRAADHHPTAADDVSRRCPQGADRSGLSRGRRPVLRARERSPVSTTWPNAATLAAADGSEYYTTVVARGPGAGASSAIASCRTIRTSVASTSSRSSSSAASRTRRRCVTVCLVDEREADHAAGELSERTGDADAGDRRAGRDPRSRSRWLLTPHGWLPTAATIDAIGIWEGSEQCPPVPDRGRLVVTVTVVGVGSWQRQGAGCSSETSVLVKTADSCEASRVPGVRIRTASSGSATASAASIGTRQRRWVGRLTAPTRRVRTTRPTSVWRTSATSGSRRASCRCSGCGSARACRTCGTGRASTARRRRRDRRS